MDKYLNTRPRSPTRAEAIAIALKPGPIYSDGVLLGNWVDRRDESSNVAPVYTPPQEILISKLQPETRVSDFRNNKWNNLKGNMNCVIQHEGFDDCGNFVTTNDLVYNHLPKPLCGSIPRRYRPFKRQFHPQPDNTKCYGNITEWGLQEQLKREWIFSDDSDYMTSLYEKSYLAPMPHQYLQPEERRGRNASFTKTIQYKMTKSR